MADLPSLSCSRLVGGVLRVSPAPETVRRRLRLFKISMELVALTKAASLAVQDGGSQEPRTVDFPSAWGLHPVQAISGGVAAARRRSVLECEDEAGILKGLSVIVGLFWVFL